VVLLIGSGLLIRSLAHLSTVELGFDPENLLTGQLQIQDSEYPTPAARNLFFSSLREEVEALPGVEAVTLANKLPILSRWQDWSIWPVGDPPASPRDVITGMARWVHPGYFRTVGIPLLSGRGISDRDGPETPYYLAAAQMAPLMLQIAVRTSVNPELLIRPIQELLRETDPNVLFAQPRSMDSVLEENLLGFRTIILSLAIFAGIALLLAAIGIYGLLAYQVTQRKAELGLRLAIGASETNLVGMILQRGLFLVTVGLVIGLALAYPGPLAVRTLLYEVRLLDPAAYAAGVLTLVVVALLASYLPARQAPRGDIVDVLRRE
jgi:hypothetical protein